METVWLVVVFRTDMIMSYQGKFSLFKHKIDAIKHANKHGYKIVPDKVKSEIGYMNVFEHRHSNMGIMHTEVFIEEPKYLRKKIKRLRR